MTRKTPPSVASPLALFRYGVVSEVRVRVARGQVRAKAVRQTAKHLHVGPDDKPRQIALRSVYRWLAAYEARGISGLENRPRTMGTEGVLEPSLIKFIMDEKREDSRASVPELIRRAVCAGLLQDAKDVDRTTVWRALKRRAIDTRRKPKGRDQRRFAKAHRLQLIMCDGKHFRAGPTRAKRVALFFIDDASRYIPVVVVGPSESAELFLRGLHLLLLTVGRIDGIYVDLGSGFVAHDSRNVIANLGFSHILGTPGYPEARGKIERFNRTVEEDLLRHLMTESVDSNHTALELRISHYLQTDYNVRGHRALKKNETPRSRFLTDERPLEPYLDEKSLKSHFFVNEVRVVTNDHVISLGGRQWEVPRGLARQKVTILRSVFDSHHLLLEHQGQTLRLAEVDLVRNANDLRQRSLKAKVTTPSTRKGAALTNAEDALAPITQADGGFTAP